MRPILFYLFTIAFCFTKLLVFPYIGSKAQLPELIFLLLFLSTKPWKWIVHKQYWNGLGQYIVILLVSFLITTLPHLSRGAVTEWIGIIYLVGVYLTTSWMIGQLKEPGQWGFKAISFLSIAILGTVAFSWGNYFFPVITDIELLEPKFIPGLGAIMRVEAFTTSPNMMASMILFCLILRASLWMHYQQKAKQLILLDIGLLAALGSTFSKSIVSMLAALCLLSLLSLNLTRPLRFFIAGGMVLLFAFYLFSSQMLLVKTDTVLKETIQQQTYFSGRSIFLNKDYELLETTHFLLKEMALKAFCENQLTGIGGGNFPGYLKEQQRAGLYPANLPIYEPHSTWFGVLAEHGVIGFLAFLLFLGQSIRISFREISRHSGEERAILTGAFVFLITLFVEAFSMDVLNFRHLWLNLGIISGLSILRKGAGARILE